jgi:hypothetical protein
MNRRQKRAAASLALTALISVTAFMLSATYLIGVLEENGESGVLKGLILAADSTSAMQSVSKGTPLLLSTVASILASRRGKDWQFFATVLITLLGLLASVSLIYLFHDDDVVKRLSEFSPTEHLVDPEKMKGAVEQLAIIVAGWFLLNLAIQIGIGDAENSDN